MITNVALPMLEGLVVPCILNWFFNFVLRKCGIIVAKQWVEEIWSPRHM
jgi:hypothetical protein